MDWPLAITRNRDALKQIVAALFALAGMRVGGLLVTLPRHVFAAVMLVLRPAESAVRRLIVIAAYGLVLKSQAPRPVPSGLFGSSAIAPTRAFALFDPLKSFDAEDYWDAARRAYQNALRPAGPAGGHQGDSFAGTPVDASLIGLRLNALMRALDDLPRQARRLVRWRERRDAMLAARRPVRLSPMRPGLPPGWRSRAIHEIDPVLRECHGLALDLLNTPNTS